MTKIQIKNMHMKKIIIHGLYLFALAALFTACRKEDNAQLPDLLRFPLPVVAKVAGSDQNITAATANTFSGKFSVGLYFPNDAPPKKYDIVAIKNNNKADVKMIKADVTSFPTEVTITGTQLATLFGAPIIAGDTFDISVDVYIYTGEKFEAFPVTGNPYASGIAAQPAATTFIRYTAQ